MPRRAMTVLLALLAACDEAPVADSDAGTDTGSQAEPEPPAAPTITSIQLTPAPLYNDGTARCEVGTNVTTPADVALTYAWQKPGDTTLLGSGEELALAGLGLIPGDGLSCRVTATAFGMSAEATVSTSVGNRVPTVDAVSVSPIAAKVGDTLTCSATVSDADGDDPTVVYEWSTGSVGASLLVTAANSEPGENLRCEATATDPSGGTASSQSAEIPVQNTPPGVPTVALLPSTPDGQEALKCAVIGEATDADEHDVTYEFSWTVDGVAFLLAEDAALYSEVPAVDVGYDEDWVCTVHAFDVSASSDAAVVSATTLPAPPVIASTEITPTPLYNDGTATCAAEATTASGAPLTVTYAWTRSPAGTPLGAGPTLSLADLDLTPGDTVACGITATAAGRTRTAVATVTLGNRPPLLIGPTVSATAAKVGDTLGCAATATDPDGETPSVTYTWSTGSEGASLILSAANTDPGDTLTCTATATDAFEGTHNADSPAAIVLNTEPGKPTLTLLPSNPAEGQALTCTVSTPATDADADDLTYEFAWTVDDVPFTLAADDALHSTVAADDVGFDETWKCTVYASDGIDSGESASTTVSTPAPPDPAPGAQIWLDAAAAGTFVGTRWDDLSGNDRDGTLSGNPVADGTNGGSVAFDGSGDYVAFTKSTTYNTVSDFSVGLWFSPAVTITPTPTTGPQMLFEAQDTRFSSSAPDNYLYFYGTGALIFGTYTPSNDVLSTRTTWTAGEWYYVVATYQSSTGTKALYVNGVLEASTTAIWSNYLNTYSHFGLGGYNSGTQWSFAGKIGMFHLYHRQLSATEVVTNYDATRERFGG